VFNAGRGADVVRLSRREARERWSEFLFRDGMTLEEMEAGLFRWLEERPWRPVSFSSGVAFLASEDGAALSVARAGRLLRLRARKTAGAVAVEFSLDLDPQTYTPQLQRIRYESPARVLEIELSAEAGPPAAAPVAFEPPATPPAAPVAPAAEALAVAAATPSVSEVEVLHALHRVRACLGEAIEVERRSDGGFLIRGVVVSPERKEQVSGALAAFPERVVSVELKSAQEALREIAPGEAPLAPAPPQFGGRGARRLAPFFGGSESLAEQFADKALSQGESIMRDAQALRELAERFGSPGRVESRQARWLLEVMEYDHLTELQAEVESARQSLKPVFGSAPAQAEAPAAAAGSWDAELLAIFRQSQALNDRLRRIFGTEGGPPEERTIRELVEAFGPLETRIVAAAGRLPKP
jgi:hypothetical protein